MSDENKTYTLKSVQSEIAKLEKSRQKKKEKISNLTAELKADNTKMKELEKSLGNDFMRTHRAYLVNLRHVRKYNAAEITLENGQTVLLAKQKYAQFVKQYMHFVRRETGGEETADE